MSRKSQLSVMFVSCCVSAIFIAGCAAKARVEPVSNTYLTDVDTTKKLANLPFEHAWVWADLRGKEFHALYIAPIDTSTIDRSTWIHSSSTFITSESDFMRETNEIARYFRAKLKEEIKATDNRYLPLVDEPGPGVVVLKMALTEIEFSHPIGRAAALAAPIPGTTAAISTITDPHVAFAARLVDGGSGTLIATAADRKFAPMRVLDLNRLTVSSSAREITASWAGMLAECFKKGPKGEVENRGDYALLPW